MRGSRFRPVALFCKTAPRLRSRSVDEVRWYLLATDCQTTARLVAANGFAMFSTNSNCVSAAAFSRRTLTAFAFATMLWSLCPQTQAQERPTLNVTRDPRPDILPYHWHYVLPEYRRDYNRPRYWTGWIAAQISPTSQEAMVWCENVHAGAYDVRNAPPRYKRYFAPKPWEVLQTGARPDIRTQEPTHQSHSATQPMPVPAEMLEIPDESVLDATPSPSDR